MTKPMHAPADTVLLHGVPDPSLFDLLRAKKEHGTLTRVFVAEGRPHLEGAGVLSGAVRELGIRTTLIADSMIAFCFSKGLVGEAMLFYHDVSAAGATCSIGSHLAGLCALHHRVPVCLYLSSGGGDAYGAPEDVFHFNGVRTAPVGISSYVPLTEVVPWKYISKLLTKDGKSYLSYKELVRGGADG